MPSRPTPRLPLRLLGVVAVLALVLAACGGDDGTQDAGGSATINVPGDHATIQEGVDAAEPGDLVLIAPGVYEEAVDVETEDLTIRGLDRNGVVLDGGFELENGIRVLVDGVAVENMTARNYTSNGFFWTGADGYRGSYLTAYRNGDYGIYAFDSVNGQLDNSLGSGSPDAGFYIGQCYPCNAVIDNVVSEYNGLGYSGTDSGGDLFVINSTFRHNRAGIVPNSGSYELCYPGRETTVVGNLVHDNNETDNPAIDVALLAQGNGILVAGGVRNVIERNLVLNHDRTGIGLVPYPEEDASDLPPPPSEWETPCEEARQGPTPSIPEDQCEAVEGILEGCAVLWDPIENRVVANVIEGSGVADLAVGSVDLLGTGVTTESLDNCFSENTFTTSKPAAIETLAPCNGEGSGSWDDDPLDLLGLLGQPAAAPPEDSYRTTPIPADQPDMPDAATAPARPATSGPPRVDLAAIAVPTRPEGI